MKGICVPVFVALVLLEVSHTATSAEVAFRVFAPSRVGESLLVVEAIEDGSALKLELKKKVSLGYPATTIVAHPRKPLLYVSTNRSAAESAPGSIIELDAEGDYARHQHISFRHGYCFLALCNENRFLFGANYGGGQVDVYRIESDGSLGKGTHFLDEGRRNAHCVLLSPDNSHVYVPYVKDFNGLYQYSFDAKTGRLSPLAPLDAKPPKGVGPRHLAHHPTLPLLYSSNEQHVGVSVFERAKNGQLSVRQVCQSVERQEGEKGLSASDIAMSPDGRWLFSGVRGNSRVPDGIARYRVGPDGKVEFLGVTPADQTPWGMTLSPDGRYLLVSGFGAGTLMAYRIAPSGDLKRVGTLEWDRRISDLIAR